MPTHPLWRPYDPVLNAGRQAGRVAQRQRQPGPLGVDDTDWAAAYAAVRHIIEEALGEQVRALDHVGSTAVPGLLAKPVLDVDLTVSDVVDEARYLPALEAAGFRLIFRDDVGGDAHRQLTLGVPNTNLHVWSPEAVEPRRHRLFVRWLSDHEEDRSRYAASKLAAIEAAGSVRYNDGKSPVVYDIYERIFISDPDHIHDLRPRSPLPR